MLKEFSKDRELLFLWVELKQLGAAILWAAHVLMCPFVRQMCTSAGHSIADNDQPVHGNPGAAYYRRD